MTIYNKDKNVVLYSGPQHFWGHGPVTGKDNFDRLPENPPSPQILKMQLTDM